MRIGPTPLTPLNPLLPDRGAGAPKALGDAIKEIPYFKTPKVKAPAPQEPAAAAPDAKAPDGALRSALGGQAMQVQPGGAGPSGQGYQPSKERKTLGLDLLV